MTTQHKRGPALVRTMARMGWLGRYERDTGLVRGIEGRPLRIAAGRPGLVHRKIAEQVQPSDDPHMPVVFYPNKSTSATEAYIAMPLLEGLRLLALDSPPNGKEAR